MYYWHQEWFNHYNYFILGIELSFFSGVYSSSIGFTLQLGENAKQLVGLSGILIGLGEVLGNDYKYYTQSDDILTF